MTKVTEVYEYAQQSAKEIWEGAQEFYSPEITPTEFSELYAERLESYCNSPFLDIPIELMYDLIEIRILRLAKRC